MVDNSINFYSAGLWTHAYGGDPNGSAKGYEFMPRMLYYRKQTHPALSPSPMNQGASYCLSNLHTHNFYKAGCQISDVFTGYAWNNFPAHANLPDSIFCKATMVDRYDYTNQFGLSYGNYWATDYDAATDTYTSVGDQIGKGLYERYYKPMISALINHPKKRVCYIDLKVTDIVQLSFRKMIHIDGIYYRLLKVVDYQPHLNVPTKVELQQWSPDKGASLPQAGTWINNVINTGGDTGCTNCPEPWDPNQVG